MPVSRFHEMLHRYRHSDAFPNARTTLDRMRHAPKFVFSDEVQLFIDDHYDVYVSALQAAAAAGHTELPHDPMVIEYENHGKDGGPNRNFWLIEGGGGGSYRLWSAMLDHRLAMVLDGAFPLRIVDAGKAWESHDWEGKPPPLSPDPKQFMAVIKTLRRQAFTVIFYAMALHVRGIVTRPAPPVDEKLDRARQKRGLPPITKDYVTVHIGYITDSKGRRHEYHEGLGNHVRVHLRRGHVRNQPFGPGLEERREIWIQPVLVNYRPGVRVADANYLVVP